MKISRNSIKQANKKLQSIKSNMLRKKTAQKYDPKYSGKPSTLDNVGSKVISRVWKQTSVSGVLILMLIGYIIYEQVGRKSAGETKMLDDSDVALGKGKVIEDTNLGDRQDFQGAKDGQYGPVNPKIKGVNDFVKDQKVKLHKPKFPEMPHDLRQELMGENEEIDDGVGSIDGANDKVDPHKPQLPEMPGGLRQELMGENEVIEDLGSINGQQQQGPPPGVKYGIEDDIGKLNEKKPKLFKIDPAKGYHKPHFPENVGDYKAYNAQNPQNPEKDRFPVQGPRYDPFQKKEIIHPEPKKYPVKILHAPVLECSEPLELLLIIHSQAQSIGSRKIIREIWGIQHPDKYERFGDVPKWKTIFVIGKPKFTIAEEQIDKEATENNDILQGEFVDNLYEDTRKFMMGLEWVTSHIGNCAPRFVIKSQDDIYHNMFSIIDWLGKKFGPSDKNIYMGRRLVEDSPVRDPENPLYVSMNDYSRKLFPNLIQGPVYLFDFLTYRSLVAHMRLVVPIAMEEGYVGLVAERAGFTPVHNDHFMLLERSSNFCHNLRLFFLYRIKASEHADIFNRNKYARLSNQCKNAMVVERNGKRYEIEM